MVRPVALGYADAMSSTRGPDRIPGTDEVMDLPADDLAGMLDRALEGEALESSARGEALESSSRGEAPASSPEDALPAAFTRNGTPYSVEELLSGLEPLADNEARPIIAPPPEPEPEPIPQPLPALDIDEDDVLILAESEEEGDAADEADEPTLAALSIIADALRALADEPPPSPAPAPAPTEDETPEQTDEVLILTDDFLADEEEDNGKEVAPQDDSTALTLQSIVAALHALTEPPPPAPATVAEDEPLMLTDAYLAPESPLTEEDGNVLILSDEVPTAEPEQEPEPLPEPEPQPEPAPDEDEAAALAATVEAIIAAHLPGSVPPVIKGETALPARLDALAQLLSDPPPPQDFVALDALYTCWPKNTQDCPSRALLAVAQNLSRNFGLPGKLPMASAKAWRMLSPAVFEAELAQRLSDVGSFIADWQKTQRTFLILEFSEIELVEYLFEALHPGYHADILAGVMNFKVLSNRRLGLLRRIPARIRRQVAPLLPDHKEKALMEMVHAKALLERVAGETGFVPIVETASKALEELDKMMKAAANTGAPPPPPGPGGGLALGRIG